MVLAFLKRHVDQWDRIKSSETSLCMCIQLFDKGAKSKSKIKDSLLNKWCWENRKFIRKRLNLDPYLTPLTKTNSKQIKRFKYKSRTIKLLEENTGEKVLDIGFVKDLGGMATKAEATKYYSAMKKQPATGDNMEGIMVISQTEKDKYCYDLTYTQNIF